MKFIFLRQRNNLIENNLRMLEIKEYPLFPKEHAIT